MQCSKSYREVNPAPVGFLTNQPVYTIKRMIQEWRQWLARQLRWLRLSGSLLGASTCLVMEVLLFFNLQETWKEWEAGKIQLWELGRFAVFIALFHTFVLGGVFWFSRQVQRIWDGVENGKGG